MLYTESHKRSPYGQIIMIFKKGAKAEDEKTVKKEMVDRLAQTVSVAVKYASPEEVELFKTLELAVHIDTSYKACIASFI